MTIHLPNNSARYFLDYTVAGYQHTLQMRCDPATTDGDAIENLSAFLEIVGPFCYPTTVDGFRFQQAGSLVSYDVAWTGIPSWGAGSAQPYHTAQFYDFVGRDIEGTRVKLSVFGAGLLVAGGDFRISPGEATWVSPALASLVSDASVFWTVAENVPVWKNYVNCGVNAYWRNKVR